MIKLTLDTDPPKSIWINPRLISFVHETSYISLTGKRVVASSITMADDSQDITVKEAPEKIASLCKLSGC